MLKFIKNLFKKEEIRKELPIYHSNKENNLEKLDINKNSLPLEKIKIEADLLKKCLKELLINLEVISNDSANLISKKIKDSITHGLELKNLLSTLEDDYYSILINKLKESKYAKILKKLENEKAAIIDMQSEITKLVVYDYKLNSEKNEDYLNAISEEIKKGELKTDIENIIDKINKILNIIESENMLEDLKNSL